MVLIIAIFSILKYSSINCNFNKLKLKLMKIKLKTILNPKINVIANPPAINKIRS